MLSPVAELRCRSSTYRPPPTAGHYRLTHVESRMTGVTIKVLHGADRGKVFHDLSPPLTIGREEGNSIQLNDERVSRCHFKVQRDNDRLVLTDLDSTNGTKVNGEECQLKILRHGDLIAIGRSLMLVGTEEQIAARVAAINGGNAGAVAHEGAPDSSLLLHLDNDQNSPRPHLSLLAAFEPPELPDRLSPGQAAQLCEILEFVQSRLHRLIESATIDDGEGCVTLGLGQWQQLLEVQSRLCSLIRQVAEP